MYRLAKGMFVVCAAVAVATPAAAELTMDFHHTAATFNCSAIDPATVACGDINPQGPYAGATEQVIVLIGGVTTGAAAVQFGIEYESTGETSIWNSFATCSASYLAAPITGPNGDWPSSGSAIAVAFTQCITPPNADGLLPVGYLFGVTPVADGTMSFIPDNAPGSGVLQIVDCSDISVDIPVSSTGVFGFDGASGVVKCGNVVPTEEHSWGEIKALF